MAFDVIIVGAGPAGSVMAGLLARQGLKTLLMDKARFPRPKPCGQGILPAGARVLARLGLEARLRGAATPLEGLLYRCGAESAACPFPNGPGLGVARLRLDAELLGWALEGGVRFEEGVAAVEPLMEGARVRGVLARAISGASVRWEAALTIAADGLHSVIRRALGIRARWPWRRRMALVGSFDRVQDVGRSVEVYLERGSEAYLTPTGEGVCAAFLYEESAFPTAGLRERRFLRALTGIEGLGRRLVGSRLMSPVLGWGPLGPRVERACGDGFLLFGDSAGAPDPITGEGIALALDVAQRGHALVARAAEAGGSALALAPFEALRANAWREAGRLSRRLVAFGRGPWPRERVVRNLRRRPELLRRMVEAACGLRRDGFGLLDGLRLVV